MWQKISFKGAIIGGAADVLGSTIWGFVAGAYLISKYQLSSLPAAERTARLLALWSGDPTVTILTMIIGVPISVMSGYMAARIANHDELLNGALASFLSVVLTLLAIGPTSDLWVNVGWIIATPILAFIGGYLRKRQLQK